MRSGPPTIAVHYTYLTKQHDVVPAALALNLRHNGVLHNHPVLLKVSTSRTPQVTESERVAIAELVGGLRQVELRFGFAEKPDVPAALTAHPEAGCDPANASFFLASIDGRDACRRVADCGVAKAEAAPIED